MLPNRNLVDSEVRRILNSNQVLADRLLELVMLTRKDITTSDLFDSLDYFGALYTKDKVMRILDACEVKFQPFKEEKNDTD
jgi:hypothetical protein